MKKAIISLIFLLSFSVGASAATNPELLPTAPERYVVQSGDTLWGIATRFLKDAWRWPELWKMNQSQLRNPHRIYPGDVLVLERSGGQVTLRLETTRLSPRVRIDVRDADAIATISPSVIEPFLSRPLIVSEKELDSAPEIMATEEDRVALGTGATAYVRGLQDQKATRWQLFRRGDLLVDPETKQSLGYVAIYLGEAELRRAGPISTIFLTSAVREVSRGDKLLPLDAEKPVFSYVPHAPATPVRARIISTYGGGGLREAGPLSIVTLSKGARDGLEVGHVLAISRELRSARYAERTEPLWGRTGPTGNDDPIAYVPAEITSRDAPLLATAPPVRASDFAQLPSERYGLLMVFRTFERASYALVMKAARPVAMSDIVSNP
ncbi:MAG: LysM domain-containing protein [Pseudomonadota bacterium]